MKVTYTKTLARRILLAFLFLVIIAAIVALFVRDSITEKLQNISRFAHEIELNQTKPQQILLLVNQAENDFQESLLNSDPAKISSYKAKVTLAFAKMDTLLRESPDTSGLTAVQHAEVHSWYNKKLRLSDSLFKLKQGFDSLLTVYANYNALNEKNKALNSMLIHSGANTNITSDTSLKSLGGKRKNLLGRLKDAFTNKDGSSSKVIEINHRRTKKIVDSTTRKVVERDKRAYSEKLKQLQAKNLDLLNTQKELIALNIRITGQLEHIIDEEKELSINLQNELKSLSFHNFEDTTLLLNKFFLVALFLVLLFAALLIAFIIRLDRSEILLKEENDRSVAMAQQKMDLLLHMSHEIRNPLTAIQGFLYIFSKSELNQKQADMLGSIRLSSDMLLQTLNDTLDAAKMESAELKINEEPFNPDFVLRETIEGMTFSATKKELSVYYDFEGDKDFNLLGDSFRLRQVINNLLSNAIKYTKTGSITVKAAVMLFDGAYRLKVDVIDTGEGISQEQQANLFSKYYQTNSSKGKLGTGLGLYICRELIRSQKGDIKVKSEAGKGSTFSFFIPYAASTARREKTSQSATAAISSLNGVSILAVDDNHLNLMFLKTMTNKWNIRFHQAGDGKEALVILNKEKIDVVLTDIEMPEMDGHELIDAIRKLKKPLNKIPVIIMTGSGGPIVESKGKKDEPGILGKPFTEAELVKQVTGALKL